VSRSDPLAHPEDLIRRVYAYVAYRIGDGPDAEDATSDVFERALRYRDTYDPAKGKPLPWLLGIAHYRLAELHAKRGPEPTADLLDGPEPSQIEEQAVERLTLGQAISALSERDRELLALRYGADMKAREIADLMGMKVNGVEVALHRVLARLRTDLAETQSASRSPSRQRAKHPEPAE